MAVGFRGSSSSGGSSSGIDFDSDYFNVPIVPLGALNSIPGFANDLTGGGSAPSNNAFNAAAFNQSYEPVAYNPVSGGIDGIDYALYQGMDPALGNFSGESAEVPSYFTTDSLTDQDIENYLSDTENFVYNPGTGEFEPAGKYTYPLSQLAPGYSDTQEKFMSGIKPGMTGDQLKAIEANRLDTQKLAFEVPMGEGLNMFDNYHEAFTGFDSSGNFTGAPVDPGTEAMNSIPDYSQPTQSVFDEGGVFSGGGKQ
tara:strand:+ start:3437 stop:4198 length:762 start_codon:yes stop_codon:yes gene_type:complete